jgi:hypothetical protein
MVNEWIDRMSRDFGIDVRCNEEVQNALTYVKNYCQCSKHRFQLFMRWFFECYAMASPKSPYDMLEAWVPFCKSEECLPGVVRADREELE